MQELNVTFARTGDSHHVVQWYGSCLFEMRQCSTFDAYMLLDRDIVVAATTKQQGGGIASHDYSNRYLPRARVVFMEYAFFGDRRVHTVADVIRTARLHCSKSASNTSVASDTNGLEDVPIEVARSFLGCLTHSEWLRALCWQLVYICHLLHRSGTKHNDLSINNLLIATTTDRQTRRMEIAGKKYDVPNMGFDVKVFDFGYLQSETMGLSNSLVCTEQFKSDFGIFAHSHHCYDVHFVLNSLILLLKSSQLMPRRSDAFHTLARTALPPYYNGKQSSELRNFRLKSTRKHSRNLPHNPTELLNHSYFKEFRC